MTDATDDMEDEAYRVGGVIDRVDFTWTTRDGQKLKLRDMQTSHIQNCIRMLQNTISTYPGEQVYMGDSEYAEEAVESENRINANRLEKYVYAVEQFERELRRRGEVNDLASTNSGSTSDVTNPPN